MLCPFFQDLFSFFSDSPFYFSFSEKKKHVFGAFFSAFFPNRERIDEKVFPWGMGEFFK